MIHYLMLPFKSCFHCGVFFLPPDVKAPGNMKPDWGNLLVLLVAAAPRGTGSDLVVSATVVPKIKTTWNTEGGFSLFHLEIIMF